MEIYHLLSRPDLTEKDSTRVCNALALLQVMISLLASDLKMNERKLYCFFGYLDAVNESSDTCHLEHAAYLHG